MKNFTVFPAIDLRDGHVVRLKQGDKDRVKAFDLQARKAAERWVDQGATWLHVVNLDGAFGEDSKANLLALQEILSAANGHASVQFGGGVRDLASIDHIFSLGVSRIILGTAAVKNPKLLQEALSTFGPERIILGVDARDGLVRVSGWEEKTAQSPLSLIKQFLPYGIATVIFTNIHRDGMQQGADIESTKHLSEATKLNVIASGGVASLEDIKAIKSAGLAGVIVGKALYENSFSLSEALSC